MKNLFSLRGVCVEPPPNDSTAVKYKIENGLRILDVSTGLLPLKVMFATDIPFAGAFVSVTEADSVIVGVKHLAGQKWAGEVYHYEGKSFVCIPYEVVFGVLSDSEPAAE